MVNILIIFGLFMFLKSGPKFIGDMLGVKDFDSGIGGDWIKGPAGLLKSLGKGGLGLAGGALGHVAGNLGRKALNKLSGGRFKEPPKLTGANILGASLNKAGEMSGNETMKGWAKKLTESQAKKKQTNLDAETVIAEKSYGMNDNDAAYVELMAKIANDPTSEDSAKLMVDFMAQTNARAEQRFKAAEKSMEKAAENMKNVTEGTEEYKEAQKAHAEAQEEYTAAQAAQTKAKAAQEADDKRRASIPKGPVLNAVVEFEAAKRAVGEAEKKLISVERVHEELTREYNIAKDKDVSLSTKIEQIERKERVLKERVEKTTTLAAKEGITYEEKAAIIKERKLLEKDLKVLAGEKGEMVRSKKEFINISKEYKESGLKVDSAKRGVATAAKADSMTTKTLKLKLQEAKLTDELREEIARITGTGK